MYIYMHIYIYIYIYTRMTMYTRCLPVYRIIFVDGDVCLAQGVDPRADTHGRSSLMWDDFSAMGNKSAFIGTTSHTCEVLPLM